MTISKLLNYLTFVISLIFVGTLFLIVSDIYPAPKSYPSHAHITIYIERNFDDFEQEKIIAAAMEWTETTNHIIEYDVVQLPTTQKIDENNSVFITKISPDHPHVYLYDKTNSKTTLGFYDMVGGLPYISLVTDRILDDDYKAVVMHELGHSLGLSHNEGPEGIGSLMFPSIDIGSPHLTLTDGKKLCKLYHCDANKLKYQEESFHF